MSYNYPIFLDVTDRQVVIVGGGTVAARKARGLVDAGCGRIRIVATAIGSVLPPKVQKIIKPYEPSDIADADLVFAATDSARVNDQIVSDAQKAGILVSRADSDDELPGDFSNAATFHDEALTVAVSTSGSPALAAAIRDELANRIDPAWVKMAEFGRKIRPMILKEESITPDVRRAIFRDLAQADAIRIVGDQGEDALVAWLTARYPRLKFLFEKLSP